MVLRTVKRRDAYHRTMHITSSSARARATLLLPVLVLRPLLPPILLPILLPCGLAREAQLCPGAPVLLPAHVLLAMPVLLPAGASAA